MSAPRTALVVDDEPVVSSYLDELLSEAGFVVVTTPTGEAALALCGDRPFDLVLSDQNLSDMTGIELTRALRARSAASRVLLLTAYGSGESALEALRAGASDYVLKPVESVDGFLARVGAALERAAEPERLEGLTAAALPADPAEALAVLRRRLGLVA